MTIALGNFNRVHTQAEPVQQDGNFRMLLTICGLVALPSLGLALFLGGWVQYLLFAVMAINIAVPVLAYFVSLHPRPVLPDEDLPAQ